MSSKNAVENIVEGVSSTMQVVPNTVIIRAARKARSACIRNTKSICRASSTGRYLLKHGRISWTVDRDGIRSDFERIGKDIAKVIDFEVKRTNKSSQ